MSAVSLAYVCLDPTNKHTSGAITCLCSGSWTRPLLWWFSLRVLSSQYITNITLLLYCPPAHTHLRLLSSGKETPDVHQGWAYFESLPDGEEEPFCFLRIIDFGVIDWNGRRKSGALFSLWVYGFTIGCLPFFGLINRFIFRLVYLTFFCCYIYSMYSYLRVRSREEAYQNQILIIVFVLYNTVPYAI